MNKMQKIKLKKEPNLDVKHKSYDYQQKAVEAIKDLDYAAIFHEQGLGKTKIALDLSIYWLEKKQVDTILIIAKKALLENWKKELEAHIYIRPRVLTQNRSDNFYVFNTPSRLMLTHYEVLRGEHERFKLFLKTRNVAVILDESTKIKNPESLLTKVFHDLSTYFKKRIIMTGTPVANRPYDIWSQIYFLDSGKSLGTDFIEFKQSADLSNDLCDDFESQTEIENHLKGIYKKISNFSVRETKDSGIISLPHKVYKNIFTDWEYRQLEMYKDLRNEMKLTILRDGFPTEDDSTDILKRLLRLVQLASNPKLIDEGYNAQPGKLSWLNLLVEEILNRNEKCIIWSSFTDNVDWLNQEYSKYNARKIHGKMAIERRNSSLDSFIDDPEVKVLIASPGAAKEGLTLTVANNVIFYDRSFSLDDYLQAQDRIHRISQNKICNIYNLIMKDSIDEWVDILIDSKSLMAQLTQGDISIDYYKSKISYSFGDVLKNILDNKKGVA